MRRRQYDDMLSRFERDRQTDRQTDRIAVSISRVIIAVPTRDKNVGEKLKKKRILETLNTKTRNQYASPPPGNAIPAGPLSDSNEILCR